eukprot:1157892-Pelagomonas_calceolata.AAC.1
MPCARLLLSASVHAPFSVPYARLPFMLAFLPLGLVLAFFSCLARAFLGGPCARLFLSAFVHAPFSMPCARLLLRAFVHAPFSVPCARLLLSALCSPSAPCLVRAFLSLPCARLSFRALRCLPYCPVHAFLSGPCAAFLSLPCARLSFRALRCLLLNSLAFYSATEVEISTREQVYQKDDFFDCLSCEALERSNMGGAVWQAPGIQQATYCRLLMNIRPRMCLYQAYGFTPCPVHFKIDPHYSIHLLCPTCVSCCLHQICHRLPIAGRKKRPGAPVHFLLQLPVWLWVVCWHLNLSSWLCRGSSCSCAELLT